MNEKNLSLEVATDLAYAYNDAYDVANESLRSLKDALRLEKLGVTLGENALTDLATASVVAEKSAAYALSVVPSFRNEVVLPTVETSPETDTLSPEEQEFKESLLAGFELSYGTYTSTLDTMNNTPERINNKLQEATETEARAEIDALLTPAVVRESMDSVARFDTLDEKDKHGLEARARVLLVVDQDLTATDETAATKDLQRLFKDAWSGDDYVYPPFHGETTAKRATKPGAKVQAVVAFDHLNIPAGTAKEQGVLLEVHNKDKNAQTEYITGDDMAFIAHTRQLIAEGKIDTTNSEYVENRFWATYYRDVLAKPVDGCVPFSCVGASGRVYRGFSDVWNGYPSRALMVPKA